MRSSLENLEKALIFITFLSLPFADWSAVFFGVPVYLPEMIVLSALIIHAAKDPDSKTPKRRIPTVVLVASLLMLSGVMSSALINGADKDALGAIKSWFLFPMAFGWLVFRAGLSGKDLWRAVSCWFFGVASVAVAALLFPGLASETYDGRLHSIFPSPNHFGFFLEYGAILGIGLMLYMKRHRQSLFLLVSAETAIVTALLLTESDGALFSVMAGSAVLLVAGLLPSGFSKKIIGIGSIFIIFIAVSMFFSLDRDTLGGGVVRDPLASRVMIWNASTRMIVEHPLVGIGPRNFQEEYLALQPEFPPYLEWAVPHPHNVFMAFWLFSGTIGLLGFSVLLAFLFWSLRTCVFRISSAEETLLPAALFALLIAFCLHGLVDTPYFRNDLSYMFWAIVALTLVSMRKKDAEAPGEPCKM
jgi:O-antigen ligase